MPGESSSRATSADEDAIDVPEQSPRPRRYRRHTHASMEPWIRLIRTKAKWGWSDKRIARRLMRETGEPWTARQVRYWRQKHRIPSSGCWKSELDDQGELRGMQNRLYASRKGWNHLLSDPELPAKQRPRDPTPRQVDILSILADHGPCTALEIVLHLRIPLKQCRDPLKAADNTHLAILMRRGWVVTAGRKEIRKGVNAIRYALAPGVERHMPLKRPTSIDLFEKQFTTDEGD